MGSLEKFLAPEHQNENMKRKLLSDLMKTAQNRIIS